MLKRIIVIVLASFIATRSYGQGGGIADVQMPKLVPPSPDAAALGKYGAIPVDKSTGIPQISIPLYEIKTPRFSLPISLSYHASGIKVDEIASWVGLGWALNAGGVITRTIVGSPDEWGGNGFLSIPLKSMDSIQWPRDSVYLRSCAHGDIDTQPDQFFYNFGDQTGAFVFGPDYPHVPVLTPYKAIKISYDTATGFNVIDEQGNHYNFNSIESVGTSLFLENVPSSWYLTRMVSADLSDTIQFNYTTDVNPISSTSWCFSQSLGPRSDAAAGDPEQVLGAVVANPALRTYQPVRISSILFKGGKIDFIAKSGRLDNANIALDSVIISNYSPATGQYARLESYKLLTDYFYSTISDEGPYVFATEPYKHRLKLTGLVENDQHNAQVKTHSFDYNTIMLPPVNNFGQDQWGYYNGQFGNQTLLEARDITIEQNTFNTTTESVVTVGGSMGAVRDVSPDDAQAGMLTKITYPTGGYTSFSYESNQIIQIQPIFFGFTAFVDGTHSHADTVNYIATDSSLSSGGNVFNIQITMYQGLSVVPFVEVIDSALGLIFTKNANEFFPVDSTVTLSLVAGHHYRLIAVTQQLTGTSSDPSFTPFAQISTSYQAASETVLTPVGGIRIASIQDYGSDNSLLSTETYKYGTGESGGGDLLSTSFDLDHFTHPAFLDPLSGISCEACGPPFSMTTYFNNSIYPLASVNGVPVGYGNVDVYQGDATHNIGITSYTYATHADEPLSTPGTYLAGVKPIPYTWKNFGPVQEAYYRNKGNNLYALERKKITNYTSIAKPSAKGFIVGYTYETLNFDQYSWPFCPQSNLYWFDYPISAGVSLPTQTILNEYDSSGTTVLLTDTTNYFYDDSTLFLPTRTATTDSKGHSSIIYSYHPLEKAAINAITPLSSTASAAIDSMVARNMISPVLQQVQYRNNNFTQLSLTNYQVWDARVIAPQNIQVQIGTHALDTRLQFNAYDARGNPLELQKTGDVKQVYLWGYNGEYPVAKLLNTDYATASGYINQAVLDRPTDDATLRSQLNNLRSIPQAQVTSFTYQPLVGMTSQTDVGNRPTYYEYDGLQRLKRIRDQDQNILKTFDYQYQVTSNCAGNCFVEAMETLAGTNTLGYPVGVFNVHGKLLGNATTQAAYVSKWNTDTADARIGTLAAGGDSLHFTVTLNTGQSLPAITGCRYYQVDVACNQFDGVRNFNAVYVDFGDSSGMYLAKNLADTPAILAPNTTEKKFLQTFYINSISSYPFSQLYFTHTYPDSTSKTVTFYHNDASESSDLDNAYDPATSLTKLMNFRGNLPQHCSGLGGSCYQQSSMTSVSAIANWNSISSVDTFVMRNGDHINNVNHIGYAQDFMQNNKGLQYIDLSGAGDTTFKLSRLKSDWNTYFTNIVQLTFNDNQWNREDISALKNLVVILFSSTKPNGTVAIDNIINQIAAGAGQQISYGVINIAYPGVDRSAASYSAYTLLKSKGWVVYINGVFE